MRKGNQLQGTKIYRNKVLIPRILFILFIILSIAGITFGAIKIIQKHKQNIYTVNSLYSYWEKYDYTTVYEISGKLLEKDYMSNVARTFRGYSAFYLGVSQTDVLQAQNYIDESIENLRIALLTAKEDVAPQIKYALGRSYFYKNNFSNYHYYADLVVKYLTEAEADGFRSNDIPEQLGLSYAALGKTRESISAFSEALVIRESDSLLFDIAIQYCNNGQGNIAKQYLFNIISSSMDDELVNRCHNLLGKIYLEEDSLDEAETEYNSVLEINDNSADAHYGLGLVYEKRGDLVKARSEWRKALRIQANHAGAIQKLNG